MRVGRRAANGRREPNFDATPTPGMDLRPDPRDRLAEEVGTSAYHGGLAIDSGGDIRVLSLTGQERGRFGRAGKPVGEFGTVNAIDCRNPDERYVSEISAICPSVTWNPKATMPNRRNVLEARSSPGCVSGSREKKLSDRPISKPSRMIGKP